jgi:hypothetical protein
LIRRPSNSRVHCCDGCVTLHFVLEPRGLVNRQDFQDLALIRLAESEVLLGGGKNEGAFYLAGYAVECALKACIAKETKEFDFPPDRKTIEQYYSHNLEGLVKAAGLETQLRDDSQQDPDLASNWDKVRVWSEQSRYQRRTQQEAQELIEAIAEPIHGVLEWLKLRW